MFPNDLYSYFARLPSTDRIRYHRGRYRSLWNSAVSGNLIDRWGKEWKYEGLGAGSILRGCSTAPRAVE